jgi:hypothetical protein
MRLASWIDLGYVICGDKMANSPSYPKQDLVPNLIKNVSKKLPK